MKKGERTADNKVVILKASEYNELIDRINELESHTKPDEVTIRWSYYDGMYASVQGSYTFSDSLRKQISRISKIISDTYRENYTKQLDSYYQLGRIDVIGKLEKLRWYQRIFFKKYTKN
jgi:hypothetical protein